MKSFQLIVNGEIDIYTNIFESDNLQRNVVVKFNPSTKDTHFIFADFEKKLERVIECKSDSFSDSNWNTFQGNRIPEEFLSPLVTPLTKLLQPVINWINGIVEDIIFY